MKLHGAYTLRLISIVYKTNSCPKIAGSKKRIDYKMPRLKRIYILEEYLRG